MRWVSGDQHDLPAPLYAFVERVGSAYGRLSDASFAEEKSQLGRIRGSLCHSAARRGEHEGHEGTEKVMELMKTAILASYELRDLFRKFGVASSLLQTALKNEKLIMPQSLTKPHFL